MKKLLLIAVCFTAIVSMSSCTDDSTETQNENSITPNKASIEKTIDTSADGGGSMTPPPKK